MKINFASIVGLCITLAISASETARSTFTILVTAPGLANNQLHKAQIPLLPGNRTFLLPDCTTLKELCDDSVRYDRVYSFKHEEFEAFMNQDQKSAAQAQEFAVFTNRYLDGLCYATLLKEMYESEKHKKYTPVCNCDVQDLSDVDLATSHSLVFTFKRFCKEKKSLAGFTIFLEKSRELHFAEPLSLEDFDVLSNAISTMFNTHIDTMFRPLDLTYMTA